MDIVDEKVERLKLLWNLFSDSPERSYERSSRFDLLLAEFIILHNEGENINELVSKFTLVNSLTTLLCCELFAQIHHLTQNLRLNNPRAAVPPQEDAEEIRNSVINFERMDNAATQELCDTFSNSDILKEVGQSVKTNLFKGTGWKVLVVVQALGGGPISCRRQFSSLLTWLCDGLTESDCTEVNYNEHIQLPTSKDLMSNLYKHQFWIEDKAGVHRRTPRRIKKVEIGRRRDRVRTRDLNRAGPSSRAGPSARAGPSGQAGPSSSNSDQDSELNNLLHRKKDSQKPIRPPVEELMTDLHKEIINSEINVFEFLILAYDLLYQFCVCEEAIVGQGFPVEILVSYKTVSFSLTQLFSFESEKSILLNSNLTKSQILQLKISLVELLIVSLDCVTFSGRNASIRMVADVVPRLLRLLKDVDSKSVMYPPAANSNESKYLSKYLFGINYITLIMIYTLTAYWRQDHVLEIRANNTLLGEFHHGLTFGRSIGLMMEISGDDIEILEYVKKLIILIMRLITIMKRVRSLKVHFEECPQLLHTQCRPQLMKVMHHHSNYFGEHYFHHNVVGRPVFICGITTFFSIFTYLIGNSFFIRNPKLRIKILKCMRSCGSCCCTPPQILVENAIKMIHSYHEVSKLCYEVLEYVIFNQVGFVKVDVERPQYCKMCAMTYLKAATVLQVTPGENSEIKYFWPFLSKYSDLFQYEDSALVHSTMNHILKIVHICNINIKHDLLFNVLHPSFEAAKNCFLMTNSNLAYFVTLSSLKLFSNLICSVSIADEFIAKGGLKSVLELMSLRDFCKPCCTILEIAIDVEIFKVQCQFYRDVQQGAFNIPTINEMVKNLPSLQLLINSLETSTERFKNCIRLKTSYEVYKNLTNLQHKRFEFLGSGDDEVAEIESENENGGINEYLDALKNCVNFWKMCSTLCLYCPILRKYLVNQTIFRDSFKLMRLLLNIPGWTPAENKSHIKLLEYLIVTAFCLSESTMNQSKTLAVLLLKETLGAEFRGHNSLRIKLILEMLIRVSSVYINDVQILPDIVKKKLPRFSLPTNQLEDAELSSDDEDESRYVCPFILDDSDQYVTADEGYEADVEICPVDGVIQNKIRNFAAANKKPVSDVTKQLKTDGIVHDSQEILHSSDMKKNYLVHEEVSHLLISVLMRLIHRIVIGPNRDTSEDEIATLTDIVGDCLNRLTSIFSIEENCTIVNKTISHILSHSAAKFLKMPTARLENLQKSVWQLIYSIGKHCITPRELKAYLNIFVYPQIPLEIILGTLSKWADDVNSHVPDYIICFPIKKTIQNSDRQMGRRENSILIASPKLFEKQHSEKRISSCWSTMGFWFSIERVGWNIWSQGFSAAMWMRLQEFETATDDGSDLFKFSSSEESENENIAQWKYKSNRYFKSKIHQHHKYYNKPPNYTPYNYGNVLHLYSIGQDNLMMEFWVNTNTGDLIIKTCSPDIGINNVFGKVTISDFFPLRKWIHFAVSVKEVLVGQTFNFEVTIFINAMQVKVVNVPLRGIMHKKIRPAYLLLGHSVAKYNENMKFLGSYCISELSVFRTPVLNQYNLTYLFAHGPNKSSLQICQVDKELLDFTPLFNSEMIETKINWDKVLDFSPADVDSLNDNILLKYSANSPTNVELYHQAIVSVKGKLGGTKAVTASIPRSVYCTWTGVPIANQHKGLPVAVYLLGGPQLFAYLFARVVETSSNTELQANALKILFKVAFSDVRLHSAFYKDDILSLLFSVFSTKQCLMSPHILKVMFDAACSESVLVTVNSRFHLIAKTTAIIKHPQILITLLKSWKVLDTNTDNSNPNSGQDGNRNDVLQNNPNIWGRQNSLINPENDILLNENKSLLEVLFMTFEILLRDTHPHKVFNMYQLNRVNLAENILAFCKERFLNSDMQRLSDAASYSLVEIIRCLIGSPPICHLVSHIVDFLILMHTASTTFMTHSRSYFYFLLSSEIPEVEETTKKLLLPFITKKINKNKKRYAKGGMLKLHRNENLPNGLQSDSASEQENLLNQSQSDNILSGDSDAILTNGLAEASQLPPENPQRNVAVDNEVPSTSQGASNSARDFDVIESAEDPQPLPRTIPQGEILRSPVLLRNMMTGSESSWIICEGLLFLLKDILSIMPDSHLNKINGVVIDLNLLTVLCNHREQSVRSSVLRIIVVLLQRYTNEEMKQLLETKYFYCLANQLTLYPASDEIVVGCASLIVGFNSTISNLVNDTWEDVTESDLMKSPPLLAILPCTITNFALFQLTIKFINNVVNRASIKLLYEVGVCELILKTLKQLSVESYFLPLSDYTSMTKDCQNVLRNVAIKALAQSRNQQILIDLYNQMSYLELLEKFPLSEHFEMHKVIRDTHSYILIYEINTIAENIKTNDEKCYKNVVNAARGLNLVENSESRPTQNVPSTPRTSVDHQIDYRSIRADLLDKQHSTLLRACTFIMTRDYDMVVSANELKLIETVFMFLLNGMITIRPQNRLKWWTSGVSTNFADHFLNLFTDLFHWIISPGAVPHSSQITAIQDICQIFPNIRELLTPTDPVKQRKLAIFLAIVNYNFHPVTQADHNIKNAVELWVNDLLSGQIVISPELQQEANDLRQRDLDFPKKSTNYIAIEKSIFIKNTLAISVTETAMSKTRIIVDRQNSLRKAFLDYLRQQQNLSVTITQQWRNIIDKHFHNKGIWFVKEFNTDYWELNEAEGPDRVRVRLRKTKVDIGTSFFNDAAMSKKNSARESSPLSYLFKSLQDNVQGGLVDRLHVNENVTFMCRAVYITVKREFYGELLLSDRCIHFLSGSGEDHQTITGFSWPLVDITYVMTRRWKLNERAVEVFLSSGEACLIAFKNEKERKSFLFVLDNSYLPNRTEHGSMSDIVNLWRNGNLSNWSYLMQLNSRAGRTYNDLMQYPVFPFILADYNSDKLDLLLPSSFRNLCKPVAIQNKANEAYYINNYNDLAQAKIEDLIADLSYNRQPYHYGSHYSNSGIVLHFLVRLPPFTKLFLQYQGRSFDLPDRTFHSLQTSWRLSSLESSSDVKELTPEFFYLPHFLCNSQGFKFGIRQCGAVVNHVELPPWASNARLFVLIHRQALESPYVKENLPNWIDLVFGYKQTGYAAIDAINVYHPSTYYGFDCDAIEDETQRNAWKTMIQTFGQIPRQLLKQPHPHCITDLQHAVNCPMEVLPSVAGLRWGSFCGSPEEPDPTISWRRHHSIPVQGLISLLNNEVIGVASGTTVMLLYNKKDASLAQQGVSIVSIILWGFPDGIIRIKQGDYPPKSLIKIPDIDRLCAVSHGYGETSSTLWLGLRSGRIIVLVATSLSTVPLSLGFLSKPIYLYGHRHPIVDISVCVPFGVAASASADGVVNIWDTYNYTHVRTITSNMSDILRLCISETLCDVATVHWINVHKTSKSKSSNDGDNSDLESPGSASPTGDANVPSSALSSTSTSNYGSRIIVNTINGVFVGSIKVHEKINCICYSNAPEGVSVNVIAVGLETGSIRLFSSWDLRPILLLTPSTPTYPIISITYSKDSQHLYACGSDGAIILWENPNGRQKSTVFRAIPTTNFRTAS